MAKKTYTSEQIEEMRAAVAAADAEQAEAARLERLEYMKPLVDFVASPEFIAVDTALASMGEHYNTSDKPSEVVRGLVSSNFPWLKQVATMDLAKPVPAEPEAE